MKCLECFVWVEVLDLDLFFVQNRKFRVFSGDRVFGLLLCQIFSEFYIVQRERLEIKFIRMERLEMHCESGMFGLMPSEWDVWN